MGVWIYCRELWKEPPATMVCGLHSCKITLISRKKKRVLILKIILCLCSCASLLLPDPREISLQISCSESRTPLAVIIPCILVILHKRGAAGAWFSTLVWNWKVKTEVLGVISTSARPVGHPGVQVGPAERPRSASPLVTSRASPRWGWVFYLHWLHVPSGNLDICLKFYCASMAGFERPIP